MGRKGWENLLSHAYQQRTRFVCGFYLSCCALHSRTRSFGHFWVIARMAATAMESQGGAMRVAIIGAGSAGMVMAKTLREVARATQRPISYRILERRSHVGGIWQLDADPGSCWLARESTKDGHLSPASSSLASAEQGRLRIGWDGNMPPGPMFQGLRTNIPSDLMAYRDVPFAAGTDLFPNRETVQTYLEDFGKDLSDDSVQFDTEVVAIAKESDGWRVKSRRRGCQTESSAEEESYYTHVAVASGRCNTPNVPNIIGLQHFKGQIMHSAWYRDPLHFRGKVSAEK